MNILIVFLTVVDVIVALVLIALILVQQSKSGGGLGTTFGGGGADTLFGAHAGSHLSRLTVIFGLIFLVVTLALAVLVAHRPKQESLIQVNKYLEAPAKTKTVSKDVAPGANAKAKSEGSTKSSPVKKAQETK